MTTRLTTFEQIDNANVAIGQFSSSLDSEDYETLLAEAGIDPAGFKEYVREYTETCMKFVRDEVIENGPEALAPGNMIVNMVAVHLSGVVSGAKAARAAAESEAVGL